jgi:hypothetical protein
MPRTRKLAASLFATGLLAVGVAAPGASAQPVITGGLVNVTVVDVLNDTQVAVQVPVGVAANVCGVNAAAILGLAAQGPVTCEADADALAFAVNQDRS